MVATQNLQKWPPIPPHVSKAAPPPSLCSMIAYLDKIRFLVKNKLFWLMCVKWVVNIIWIVLTHLD
jgi:hypothetical protein